MGPLVDFICSSRPDHWASLPITTGDWVCDPVSLVPRDWTSPEQGGTGRVGFASHHQVGTNSVLLTHDSVVIRSYCYLLRSTVPWMGTRSGHTYLTVLTYPLLSHSALCFSSLCLPRPHGNKRYCRQAGKVHKVGKLGKVGEWTMTRRGGGIQESVRLSLSATTDLGSCY